MEVLADPMNLPSTFWDYMIKRWLRDAPVFPISQVFGFTAFTAQSAPKIATSESTSSGTYVDLATTGPLLTLLPDGHYLFFYGAAHMNSVSGSGSKMSISVNGSTPVDSDATGVQTAVFVNAMTVSVQTLSNNGSNTVKAQYRVTANTGTFADRFVIGLKYSNL